jgi:hypothetical protein
MYYYVNRQAQSNGDHEVHQLNCVYLPSESNRLYLGDFMGCSAAVAAARNIYPQSDGCYFCSNACHTS